LSGPAPTIKCRGREVIASKPSCKLGRGKGETLMITKSFQASERPELFLGGGGGPDPEAINKLCMILKNYVIKIMS
jgi:hypothetical protein